jgi:hypothetical protein
MFGDGKKIRTGYRGPLSDVIVTTDGDHIKEGYGGPLC